MIAEHGALVEHQPAGGKQRTQLVRRKRLHMNLSVPARPQDLRDARRVRVVALVGAAGQRGSDMPSIQANHIETLLAQPLHQPRRQRPGLQADAYATATAGAAGFDFTAGYCKPTSLTDFRKVLVHSGDVLTLLLPFEFDVLNGDVQVLAGCDHLIEGDCALVFDNVAENGSFSFVPKKDIFATGLD